VNKIKHGHVTPWWSDSYKELNYAYYPLKASHEDFLKWKFQGYDRFNINGGLYDMRNTMPDYTDKFFQLQSWNDVGVSYYCMKPFDFLPLHKDHYLTYIEKNKISNPKNVWRCIVFLEDWKSGHYFEIDGYANTNWKAGDWVSWNYDVPHVAGNIGTEDRYTVQITGWVNDD